VLESYGRNMEKRNNPIENVYSSAKWYGFRKLLKPESKEELTCSAVMSWSWFTKVNKPAEPQKEYSQLLWSSLTQTKWQFNEDCKCEFLRVRYIFSPKNKKTTREKGTFTRATI
jgi:hypothetical protein